MYKCLAVVLLLAGCAAYDTPPATLRAVGTDLTLTGTLDGTTVARFRAALAAHPEVTRVILTDIPGSYNADSVAVMGRALRAARLDTHIASGPGVFSGGVDLHLAGVQRTVAPGAAVGVHAWENAYRAATDYPRGHRAHQRLRGYVAEMLGSDAFYWFSIRAAGPNDIHLMTRAELRRYGLISGR